MNSQDWMIGRSSISPGNPFRGAKRETPGRLISPPALRIMGRSLESDTVDTPLPSMEYTDPQRGRRIAVGRNIVEKIIRDHYVSGEKKPGKEGAIRIDQTLTQDATGTMAYLPVAAMGAPPGGAGRAGGAGAWQGRAPGPGGAWVSDVPLHRVPFRLPQSSTEYPSPSDRSVLTR